ncbi:MAG TPA: hypothetical protein VEG66_03980 [Thermoplasmata archaeon]|jgi:hypothetical protein|nr:hypothetical protein [Thermoplasmata archaeon]
MEFWERIVRGQGRKLGARIVAACLGVVLLTVALLATGPTAGADTRLAADVPGPSGVGPARTLPGVPSFGLGVTPASAPIAVSLSVSSANVEVGTQVTFQLNISLVGCTPFNLSSLGELTLTFGDGTSYQKYANNGGPGSALYCAPPPYPDDTSDVEDVQYAYPNPGTYSVSAQLNWSSGPPLLTNSVAVEVAGSPIAFAVDGWFYGVIGTAVGAILLVVVFRRKLPKPPSLPPGAA